MKVPVYLDYNATTPVDPRVLEAMLPWFSEKFGNAASSTHAFGWAAESAVKLAREQIAEALACDPQEIVFTSGATEAVNLAIKGVAQAYASRGNHIITVSTEHKAVLDVCKQLERQGSRVTVLGVDRKGRLDLAELQNALSPETILVSVMLANNETGLIHPLREIGEVVHAHGAILMTDATQAVGKVGVKVDELGADLLALSGHKFYGPKGIGALFVRRRNPRVRLVPQIDGGGHEGGRRSGTLNVPGIVGLGKAIGIAMQEMETESDRLKLLRDRLEQGLLKVVGAFVNGDAANRLAHVSNMGFPFAESDALVRALHRIAVATGSACTSALMEPSHVLRAMGLRDDLAYASIRFSLGRFTTEEEVDFAIAQVSDAVQKLRALSPAWKAWLAGGESGK
jgi:cysteine desulfurase